MAILFMVRIMGVCEEKLEFCGGCPPPAILTLVGRTVLATVTKRETKESPILRADCAACRRDDFLAICQRISISPLTIAP